MASNKNLLEHFISDLRVDLTEEFDRNFERKAFFDKTWKSARYPNRRGSLLMRTGALRRSLRSNIAGNSILYSSSLPYAAIQNEGGIIVVTAKMKKFFWAMYYKSAGAISKNKSGKASNTNRNRVLSAEAGFYKAMALKKVGSKITIEARPFIGPHRQVDMCVERVFKASMIQIEQFLTKQLKP